jgi:hypothetical protein
MGACELVIAGVRSEPGRALHDLRAQGWRAAASCRMTGWRASVSQPVGLTAR